MSRGIGNISVVTGGVDAYEKDQKNASFFTKDQEQDSAVPAGALTASTGVEITAGNDIRLNIDQLPVAP